MSGALPPQRDGRSPAAPNPAPQLGQAGQGTYDVDELLSAIGHQVRSVRQTAELHQETLAGRAGVSRSHIVRLEHHPTNISLRYLHPIAEALGVPLSQIIAAAEDQVRATALRPTDTGPQDPSPTTTRERD